MVDVEPKGTQKTNYFLMRSPKALLKDNKIGYGWKHLHFSDYDNVEKVLAQLNAGRRKNQIKRFFNLKEGDVILVPLHCSVAIGIVKGDKSYDENAPKNTWNQVAVDFLKEDQKTLRTVSTRDNLITNRLLGRLRLRMTIASLNEFSDEIEKLKKISESGEYNVSQIYNDNEESRAAEVKASLLSNLRSGNNLRIKGGGDGFEELICELLRLDGFNADIQSKKSNRGKGDIDIKAKKELPFGVTLRLDIQAKHHKGETSVKSVDQVAIAKKNHEVNEQSFAMVITTAAFSDEAKNKAETEDITLIDGGKFVDWLYDKLSELSTSTLYGLGISVSPTLCK